MMIYDHLAPVDYTEDELIRWIDLAIDSSSRAAMTELLSFGEDPTRHMLGRGIKAAEYAARSQRGREAQNAYILAQELTRKLEQSDASCRESTHTQSASASSGA